MTEIKEPTVIQVDAAANKPYQADVSTIVNMNPQVLVCRLGLHRWSAWSGPIIEQYINQSPRYITESRRYQVQICLRCNKRRERKIAQL